MNFDIFERKITIFTLVMVSLAGIVFLPEASSGDKMVCGETEAVGISYDESTNAWMKATFRSTPTYIVSLEDTGWQVRHVGSRDTVISCVTGDEEELRCHGENTSVFINLGTKKMLVSNTAGYWDGDKGYDPAVAIGFCKPIPKVTS